MSEITVIALDAMGGDNAPGEMVKGAVDALGREQDIKVYLLGKEDMVNAELQKYTYDKNRLALYNGLKDLGFECIKPEGAFYLFVKSPVADEKEFCEAGKKYNILMVPGSSFACPGYVRLAYCVSYDTIINSLPQFAKLAKEFEIA